MKNRSSLIALLALLLIWQANNTAIAQNATALVQGKVIDQAGQPVANVQVKAREGDITAGKSKTQSAGEFTIVLKPGKTYSMSFERYDIMPIAQELQIPASTSHQDINKSFTVKLFRNGDILHTEQVFKTGTAIIENRKHIEEIADLLKKVRGLGINAAVSGAVPEVKGKKAKKAKPAPKKKGKSAEPEQPVLTLAQQRIQALADALIALGISASRFTVVESAVSAPADTQFSVREIKDLF